MTKGHSHLGSDNIGQNQYNTIEEIKIPKIFSPTWYMAGTTVLLPKTPQRKTPDLEFKFTHIRSHVIS